MAMSVLHYGRGVCSGMAGRGLTTWMKTIVPACCKSSSLSVASQASAPPSSPPPAAPTSSSRKWTRDWSSSQAGLLEFLDAEGGAGSGKAGRAWSASELRLKSLPDLHKIWFVLVKERAVLETERGWCKTNGMHWTHGASNLNKIKTAMARVKGVIGERCRLYTRAKRFCVKQDDFQDILHEAKRAGELKEFPMRDPMLEEIIRWEFSTIGKHRRDEILQKNRMWRDRLDRDRQRRRDAWLTKKRITSQRNHVALEA